jgi:putative flippase GtrA
MAKCNEISIIIPMRDEEDWVENAYHKLKTALKQYSIEANIIFATDGCKDRTIEIIQRIQQQDSSIIHINHPEQLGRGLALKNIFKMKPSTYLIYMDSDMASDLNFLPEIIAHLKEGADIVTGSRLMKGSICIRSKKRDVFSKTYNKIIRLLFRSTIYDHQCGFKGFRIDSIFPFLDDLHSNGWFWDTEMLIKAQKRGLRLVEIPISWSDRDPEVSKVKVWQDSLEMGIALIKLRWELLSSNIQEMAKFILIGCMNTIISLLILFGLDNTLGRGIYGYPVAYLAGAINSFFLNRKFTFREKKFYFYSPIQFIMFLSIGLIGMTVYSLTAFYLESIFQIHYLLAAIGGTLVNFIVQFFFSKYLVFSSKKKK